MGLLSLLAAFSMQSPEIGQISKEEFVRLINDLGFGAKASASNPYLVTISDGKTTIDAGFSYARDADGKQYIYALGGALHYHLPRNLPKKGFEEWAKANNVKSSVSSYLGGRTTIVSDLGNPKTTEDALKLNIRRFIDEGRLLDEFAAKERGQRASEPRRVTVPKLDMSFKLDWVEAEDIDHLRDHSKWEEYAFAGTRGWTTGAKPLGVPVIASGMGRSFSLTCIGKGNAEKVERYLMSNPPEINWADYVDIKVESIYIQSRFQDPEGITVGNLKERILTFAKSVKNLDLF